MDFISTDNWERVEKLLLDYDSSAARLAVDQPKHI
jgi:hypothetical protein